MNPLFQAAIGAILRWFFALGAGYLVEHGIWSQSEASTYVTAAALAAVSLGWSLWAKYHSRIKFLTALEAPAGSSEADVKATIDSGMGASATGSGSSVDVRKITPVLLLALLPLVGCGSVPPPALTPQANVAYQARRVLDVLRVVRDVAIDAEAQNPKLISTADARTVVNWHESLVKAIDAAPDGAKATVLASLTELQKVVAASTWSRIAPYVALVRTVLEGV